ncbi:MAG: alanine/glycine:cation symporter family protein [Prevotella sp.]
MRSVFSDMVNVTQMLSDYLWTYVVIVLLVFCAFYFTLRGRGLQFRLLRDMWRVVIDKPVITDSPEGHPLAAKETGGAEKEHTDSPAQDDAIRKIGSFQAFAVSLSSRVGTGNLAGVASAIFIGGPGAVFWMWMMAMFGAATAFVESTLAQLYKRRGEESFYGGPAYYMQSGLHCKWMGVLFAVLITITFGIANQVVQSNTLCDALSDASGISNAHVGMALTAVTLSIIFGGVHRISRFASMVVPFMAMGYILLALVIIVLNISQFAAIVRLIVSSAFGLEQAVGGAVGAAILQGVKRGLFSNEAGEGSAPNAAAIANTTHPVKQGLLQSLGVFVDTLLICSCTAFIILLSGLHHGNEDGILLTKRALEMHVGAAGGIFLTIAIFLFAFSTIIANYFYGETNIRFITRSKWAIQLFRIITGGTVMLGALVTLQTAWSFVDLAMGVMTIVNLVAIIRLSPKAFALFRNYMQQRRKGVEPRFRRDMMPADAADIPCWEK